MPGRSAPKIKARHTLSTLRSLKKDALGFLIALHREHGDVLAFDVGPYRTYLLSSPAAVKRVLVDHASNYTKYTRDYDMLRLSLGDGMLTSEGEFWRRQRRIAQPSFGKKEIGGFAGTMGRLAFEMVDHWRSDTLDVAHEMMRVTLKIVNATLFSLERDLTLDEIGTHVARINKQTMERIMSLLDVPLWVPTRRNRELHQSTAFFDQLVASQLVERRAQAPKSDLLGTLLAARDPETGESMSDQQLRDEAITMLAAGHETTATALAWCFHLLSKHPEVERRASEEAQRVLAGRACTLDDVPKLVYCKQVFQETMRLYPPVWAIGRKVEQPDEIDGFAIEAGADVTLSQYVIHRHPALWERPDEFDPERFAEGREVSRYQYFPFSGGGRQCIGAGFAMMEGQIILATVLSRFRLDAMPGRVVDTEPLVTLRPRGGLPMQVAAR